jgi:hypothetical protein
VREFFKNLKGSASGIPVAHVVVNLEASGVWQAQTDTFLKSHGVTTCGDDYTKTNVNVVRNLFAPPTANNPSPRPVFVVINCVSNSPSHAYRQLLVNEIYPGGGAQDFGPNIANWRRMIDAVEAPPPEIRGTGLKGGGIEFTVAAQRGRTNQIEWSEDFKSWQLLTRLPGTNAPVTEPDLNLGPQRFYRVVRP